MRLPVHFCLPRASWVTECLEIALGLGGFQRPEGCVQCHMSRLQYQMVSDEPSQRLMQLPFDAEASLYDTLCIFQGNAALPVWSNQREPEISSGSKSS